MPNFDLANLRSYYPLSIALLVFLTRLLLGMEVSLGGTIVCFIIPNLVSVIASARPDSYSCIRSVSTLEDDNHFGFCSVSKFAT